MTRFLSSHLLYVDRKASYVLYALQRDLVVRFVVFIYIKLEIIGGTTEMSPNLKSASLVLEKVTRENPLRRSIPGHHSAPVGKTLL